MDTRDTQKTHRGHIGYIRRIPSMEAFNGFSMILSMASCNVCVQQIHSMSMDSFNSVRVFCWGHLFGIRSLFARRVPSEYTHVCVLGYGWGCGMQKARKKHPNQCKKHVLGSHFTHIHGPAPWARSSRRDTQVLCSLYSSVFPRIFGR